MAKMNSQIQKALYLSLGCWSKNAVLIVTPLEEEISKCQIQTKDTYLPFIIENKTPVLIEGYNKFGNEKEYRMENE